jgi:hypothetical protein
MNKKIIIFLLTFFVLFYISTTIFVQTSNQLAFAQNNNQSNQTGNNSNQNNQNQNDTNVVKRNALQLSQTEEPGAFISQLYTFFLAISGLLAFFVIIWGGVQRVINAGNPEKIKDADEWIKSALLGLLLLFGAWLLLHTINPNLVKLELPKLQPIKVEERPEEGGGGGGAGPALSESEARSKLLANGITVNAQPPQTSLNGVKQATIDETIRMKKECDAWMKSYYPNENNGVCNVVVTAGTENGPHATGRCSHGNGYKIDLGLSPRLNEFIEKTYCCKNPRTNQCEICGIRKEDGALLYKASNGTVYAKETTKNHWDVVVNCK